MNGKPRYETADDLLKLSRGFIPSRVILTAAELGVFASLAKGPRTSREVAKVVKADERGTDRLLNALVALALLTKAEGRFALTDAARRWLLPSSPDYLAGLSHASHMYHNWGTLTEAVKKGGGVSRRRDGETAASFIAAMHYLASRRGGDVVKLVGAADVRRVLDVGGGSGAYAMAFCRAHPAATAVVFDLAAVVPVTRRYIKEAAMAARVKAVAGDALRDALPGGFDVVFVSQLLHSNSPRENERLLKKCARALAAEGRLVVQEFVADDDRAGPPHPLLFALNMLVATGGGDAYTEREIRAWLTAAGMTDILRLDTPFETTLVLGRKG